MAEHASRVMPAHGASLEPVRPADAAAAAAHAAVRSALMRAITSAEYFAYSPDVASASCASFGCPPFTSTTTAAAAL